MTTNQENNSYSHWSGRFLACLDVSLIPLYPHFNGHQLEIHCWTSNRIQTHRIMVFFFFFFFFVALGTRNYVLLIHTHIPFIS